MKKKWGLYDTVDNLWMGNNEGPLVYDVEQWAKLAAQVMNKQLGYVLRIECRVYDESPKHLKDEVKAVMSGVEAIKNLEEGGI